MQHNQRDNVTNRGSWRGVTEVGVQPRPLAIDAACKNVVSQLVEAARVICLSRAQRPAGRVTMTR
jgi:hypothetical protein